MENRTVEMKEFKENPDGSATVSFDFSQDEVLAFYRMGVIQSMKNGLKEAEEYHPEHSRKFSSKSFKMTWDQLDVVVTDELKDCYENQMKQEPEHRDYELIHALDTVLKYYLDKDDYFDWMESLR
jgi:hypothetical protein